ncbi:MAG TPA: hypothetical protein VE954_18315 [Oligoflexus sp.]|uniref:hypothetical protein n=1 Tax=Oligoflexus sp. TaxID=1971216 RepID=UPI002D42302E|nr:hypothetical protein [Oligoflexus sp.]HYX35056.1 hypothetical protein [Oligoflexus sp.]
MNRPMTIQDSFSRFSPLAFLRFAFGANLYVLLVSLLNVGAVYAADQSNDLTAASDPFGYTEFNRSWVGLGFDSLTGLPKDPCFIPEDLSILVTPRNQTIHSSHVIRSHGDMSEAYSKSTSSGISFSFFLFSAAFSESSAKGKSARLRTDEVIAVAQTTVVKEVRQVRSSVPTMTSDAIRRLQFSPLAFRSSCGDAFVKQATLGSRMSIVFRGRLSKEQMAQKEEARQAIGFGLLNYFNFNQASASYKENRELFNQIKFSTECFVEGVNNSSLCTHYNLSLNNRENLETLAESFKQAQLGFAESASAKTDEFVMLEWKTEPYPEPYQVAIKDRALFYPISDRVLHLAHLNALGKEISSLCSDLETDRFECVTGEIAIEDEIRHCADQGLWENPGSKCSGPPYKSISDYREEFKSVLALGRGGAISLFASPNRVGTPLDLHFGELYSPSSHYRAGVLYDLSLLGFPPGQLGSAMANLEPNWKITFFEGEDGLGRNVTLQGQEQSEDLRGFGYFMIQR